MEGVTAMRVYREVQFSYVVSETTAPAVFTVQAPVALPPPPEKNNRCLNAFLLAFTYFMGLGSIILGAKHFHNCPAQPSLPSFVIAFGAIVIVQRILNYVYDWRSIHDEEVSHPPRWLTYLNLLLLVTDFIIFFVVCHRIYSIRPVTTPDFADSANYCVYELYSTCLVACYFVIVFIVLPVLYACCCKNRC